MERKNSYSSRVGLESSIAYSKLEGKNASGADGQSQSATQSHLQYLDASIAQSTLEKSVARTRKNQRTQESRDYRRSDTQSSIVSLEASIAQSNLEKKGSTARKPLRVKESGLVSLESSIQQSEVEQREAKREKKLPAHATAAREKEKRHKSSRHVGLLRKKNTKPAGTASSPTSNKPFKAASLAEICEFLDSNEKSSKEQKQYAEAILYRIRPNAEYSELRAVLKLISEKIAGKELDRAMFIPVAVRFIEQFAEDIFSEETKDYIWSDLDSGHPDELTAALCEAGLSISTATIRNKDIHLLFCNTIIKADISSEFQLKFVYSLGSLAIKKYDISDLRILIKAWQTRMDAAKSNSIATHAMRCAVRLAESSTPLIEIDYIYRDEDHHKILLKSAINELDILIWKENFHRKDRIEILFEKYQKIIGVDINNDFHELEQRLPFKVFANYLIKSIQSLDIRLSLNALKYYPTLGKIYEKFKKFENERKFMDSVWNVLEAMEPHFDEQTDWNSGGKVRQAVTPSWTKRRK